MERPDVRLRGDYRSPSLSGPDLKCATGNPIDNELDRITIDVTGARRGEQFGMADLPTDRRRSSQHSRRGNNWSVLHWPHVDADFAVKRGCSVRQRH